MDDALKLGITIHIPQIAFYMSKQTIPRVLFFLYRVGAIFSEKRIMADSLLINILGTLYSGKKIVVVQDVPRQVLSLSSFYGFIISDLKVFSSQCFGTLSGNRYFGLNGSFRDTVCAQVKIINLQVALLEEPITVAKIKEKTVLSFDSFTIRKTTLKSITPQEERMWTDAQILSFLNVASSQNIISVPKTEIGLETESFLLDLKVEYSLSSSFASGVDVALNLGLFQFVKDLVLAYQTASLNMEAQGDSEVELGSEFESAIAKIQFVPAKPLTFVKKKLNFEPLLKLTGEATPKDLISKLGLNIEQIPMYIYGNIIYLSLISQCIGKGYKLVVVEPKEDIFYEPTLRHHGNFDKHQ
jgi:hypothetical protein